MATDFASQVKSELWPQYQQSQNQLKARFADSGLMNSTAAQGAYSNNQNNYIASLNREIYNRQSAERDRALRLYDMLYAGALQRQQYNPKRKVEFPTIPNYWYKNAFADTWGGSPTGDPPENEPTASGAHGGTIYSGLGNYAAAQQAAANARANEANAIARERLRFDMAEANKNSAPADPYDKIWQTIDSAPETAYAGQPNRLLNLFITSLGVDVVKDATEGNPKAVAALKLMYPGGSWQSILQNRVADNPQFRKFFGDPAQTVPDVKQNLFPTSY